MDELEALLELGEEFARKMLLEERHKQLMPTYHLISADDKHTVISCTWENDLQKRIQVAMVREEARKMKCRAFSFVSEGWTVTRPLDKAFEGPQPRDDPARMEIVNISAGNTSGIAAVILHMVRDLSPGMNNRLIALELIHRLHDGGGDLVDGIVQPQERSH